MIVLWLLLGYICSVLFARQCIIEFGDPKIDREVAFALFPIANVFIGIIMISLFLGKKIKINHWFWGKNQ